MKLELMRVLSDSDLEAIHEASLDVLAKTGVVVHSADVLLMLGDAGASIERGARLARIPKSLVESCLKQLPARITLCNRLGEESLFLNSGRSYAASGHNAIYVLRESGGREPATKQDVADFARLSDALPNIHAVGVQAMPQDVQAEASLLHAVEACFANTGKHLYFSPESSAVTRSLLEMVKAAGGAGDLSRSPIATCQLSSTSPLFWETGAVESLVEVAKSGLPCCLLPQPYSGVTAPITLAGTLVIHNAEVLSGIVISQLARAGAPIIYGSAWTTFDMRQGNVTIGSPEAVLLRVAGAQLARYYNMPSHTIGPDSDSHCHDEQNAWEKALTAACAIGAGVDLVVNAGMFATGLTVSFEQLVLDDEILGMAFRLAEGIEVDEDSLAKGIIHEVGPSGNFLMHDHTVSRLRSGEHWLPRVSNRMIYDNWLNAGAEEVVQTARAMSKRILREHLPPPLPEEVRKELSRIIAAFESRG